MKLETNMYVRTKNGMIAKIISKEDVSGSLHKEEIVFILDNGNRLALHSKKVIKSSHNIIDLIKIGDYVNGLKVYEVRNDIKGFGVVVFSDCSIHEWQINSIVTKENFESMSYKVEE